MYHSSLTICFYAFLMLLLSAETKVLGMLLIESISHFTKCSWPQAVQRFHIWMFTKKGTYHTHTKTQFCHLTYCHEYKIQALSNVHQWHIQWIICWENTEKCYNQHIVDIMPEVFQVFMCTQNIKSTKAYGWFCAELH